MLKIPERDTQKDVFPSLKTSKKVHFGKSLLVSKNQGRDAFSKLKIFSPKKCFIVLKIELLACKTLFFKPKTFMKVEGVHFDRTHFFSKKSRIVFFTIIETSRERHKSAPYLRPYHKKTQKDFKVSSILLQYTKNPKVEANWLKVRTLSDF